MVMHYLKMALRSLKRNLVYSFINIIGLSVGLTCGILILMWVKDELTYEKFNKNYDHIYQVYETQNYANGYILYTNSTPGPLSPFLKQTFPEITFSTRLGGHNLTFKYNDKLFSERVGFIDSSYFDIFTVDFLQGDPKTCILDKNTIVLTEKLAEKYFPGQEAMGKEIRLNNKLNVKVTGIIKNLPNNTQLKLDCFVNFMLIVDLIDPNLNSWGWNSHSTFVLLPENVSIIDLEKKVENVKKNKPEMSPTTTFHFNPLSRVHLYELDPKQISYITIVNILTGAAIFLLLIACINFMNLATARSANRAKEVGIRKVVGAERKVLIFQFLGESLFLTFIAFGLSILLADLFLPTFNILSDKKLSIGNWDILFVVGLTGLAVFAGLLSGSYPALYLSRFKPIEVLKGNLRKGSKGGRFRKGMVIFQFTLTIILVIVTLFTYKQLNYIYNKDMGYNRNNMIYFKVGPNYDSFKKELKSIPGVTMVTACTDLPLRVNSSTSSVKWQGKDTTQEVLISFSLVDYDYIETFHLKMAEGRSFSEDYAGDTANIIINEKAAKLIGIEPIIGLNIDVWGTKGKVIGVVKDFHFQHLSAPIDPLFMATYKSYWDKIVVRIDSKDMQGTIAKTETLWKRFNPDYPFEYELVISQFDEIFKIENQIKNILFYFTMLALFVACMGLFGLAAYLAEQQSKVMVIRKVHGASVFQIIELMTIDFGKWVLISSAIAIPIAYFAIKKMFSNYTYHTEISAWIFIAASLGALLIATITVMYQAIKTARQNPVDYLKYE